MERDMQANDSYPSAMKILHWFMAFLLIGMIALGWYMSELAGDDPLRGTLISLHKSFGVTIFILVFIRIAVRLSSVKPKLPEQIKSLEACIAKFGYAVFYFLMIAIPFSGYKMSTQFGFPVKLFGLELPKLFPIDKIAARDVAEWHEILAYSLLAMIGLHVAGVVKHIVIDKVNLLKRMW